MTVHRGVPNRTDRLRQSVDMRYQRAREPVTEISLSPYPGTGTWDDIYADWQSDTLKYYWRGQSPQIAPFDRRYYEERDQKAFAMARRGDAVALPSLLRIMQRDPDAGKRQVAERLVTELNEKVV